MNQYQLFVEFHCTHAKDNKKKYGSGKQHDFHGSDKSANQKVKFYAISNFMTFLKLRVKV